MRLKLLLFSKDNLNFFGYLMVALIFFGLSCETKTPPLDNQSTSSKKDKASGKKEETVSLEKADEPVSISGMYLACASVVQPPNGQNNAYLGCRLGDKKTNNRVLLYQKATSKKWTVNLPKDSGFSAAMIDQEKFKSFWNVIFVFTPKSSSLSGFHLLTTSLPTGLDVSVNAVGLDPKTPTSVTNFQPENKPSNDTAVWTLPNDVIIATQPEEDWWNPKFTYDQNGEEIPVSNTTFLPTNEEPENRSSTSTTEIDVFDDDDTVSTGDDDTIE